MSDLILEIQDFCRRNGMAETRFGELALNDKPFVSQLRNGRRVWPETAERVRAFMADFAADAGKAAA